MKQNKYWLLAYPAFMGFCDAFFAFSGHTVWASFSGNTDLECFMRFGLLIGMNIGAIATAVFVMEK